MKSIMSIVMCIILNCATYAEILKDQYFYSKEKCEEACLGVLSASAKETFSIIVGAFTDDQETIEKSKPLIAMTDHLKTSGGNLECIQKIGEQQLGDIYFKVGYIVKYENSAIFVEFILLRSSKGYQPKFGDIIIKTKQSDFLKAIPDYCWK